RILSDRFDLASATTSTKSTTSASASSTDVLVRPQTTTTKIPVLLQRGDVVSGVVKTASGEPVADADIWLSDKALLQQGFVVARPAPNGTFSFHCSAPERWIGARASGWAPSRLHQLQGACEDIALIVDARAESVRGMVRTAKDLPVPGARVYLTIDAMPD